MALGVTGASTIWSLDEVERFEAATASSVALVVGFADLAAEVPVHGIRSVVAHGAVPVITLEVHTHGDDPIATINRGAADADLTRWGRDLARVEDLVVIRFAHEMNGSWYPWGREATDPASYRTAFARVRSLLRAEGAEIEMMWSPNVWRPGEPALDAWYPGDGVVDLVGLSGYAELAGVGDAEDLFGPSLDRVADLAPGVPVVLAETACASGRHRAQWIDSLLRVGHRTEVVGVSWFDLHKEHSWRLSDDASQAMRLGAGISARRNG